MKKTEKQKVKVVTEYVEVERELDKVEETLCCIGFVTSIVIIVYVLWCVVSFFYDTYQTNKQFREHQHTTVSNQIYYDPGTSNSVHASDNFSINQVCFTNSDDYRTCKSTN